MEVIEEQIDLLLYPLEQNDIVLLPNVGSVQLLKLLDSKFDESILFVCDNKRLEYISNYTLNNDYYEDLSVEGSVCWMTYDLVFFNMLRDEIFFKKFKLVVFDGIDERGLESDLVFSLIVNFKFSFNNCLVLLKSSFDVKFYSDYFKKSFSVFELNLISLKNPEVFYSNYENYKKGIVDTINTIFEKDNSVFDVLVILPFHTDLEFLKDYNIKLKNYSIVTKIEDFNFTKSIRRIIFVPKANEFSNVNHHSVRYVIDTGRIKVLKADSANPSISTCVITQTSLNHIRDNIASVLLTNKNQLMKYFILTDKTNLISKDIGLKNGSNLIYYLPGLCRILSDHSSDFSSFTFITKPDESVLRSCINELIYFGILQLKPNFAGVQLTEKGLQLLNYHFTKNDENFSLFISLIYNEGQNDSILKIITVWNVLNKRELINYMNKTKPDNEFIQMLEIFESFDTNPIRLYFDKSVKKKLFKYFKRLKEDHKFNNGSSFKGIVESLLFGFAFKFCLIEDGKFKPMLISREENSLIIKDKYYKEGDIVLVSSITMIDDLTLRYDMNSIICVKVPKRILFDMNLPLFKFK